MEQSAEETRTEPRELPAELRRFNWGAFLIAPIWGVANGQWPGVFFLPVWAFVDNVLRGPQRFGVWQAALGWGMALVTLALQAGYALMADRLNWARSRGALDVAPYLRRQRIWAIVGVLVFLGMIVWIGVFLMRGTPGAS